MFIKNKIEKSLICLCAIPIFMFAFDGIQMIVVGALSFGFLFLIQVLGDSCSEKQKLEDRLKGLEWRLNHIENLSNDEAKNKPIADLSTLQS